MFPGAVCWCASRHVCFVDIDIPHCDVVGITDVHVLDDCAGKGPVDNLFDHLANPAAINFTTNGVSLPGIPYMQP